jgi:DNA-binding NtrC family response regulator
MLRVLIVDDDHSALCLLENYLIRKSDWQIRSASGGIEAFKLVQLENFSIIVSDFDMPDGSGLDLLTNLRKFNINIPFILYSASPCTFFDDSLGLPLRAIVSKPNLAELWLSIQHAIAG